MTSSVLGVFGCSAHAGEPRPLVHRFEHAAEWKARLEGPERDASQQPELVIEALALRPGAIVADIGAGTGYFEPHLARAVGQQGRVLAIDGEPDMVRYLKERVVREHLDNVSPQLASSDDPQLAAGSVDRILIVNVWHHIAAREAYASKLMAALRPGGRLLVVDFTQAAQHGPPAAQRVAPETVVQELQAAGFHAELSNARLPEQYMVVGRRA